MTDEYTVSYYEHTSSRPYEELIETFETQVASADGKVFTEAFASAGNGEEFTAAMKSLFGPSGFVHVLTIDLGRWLGLYGKPAKAAWATPTSTQQPGTWMPPSCRS